MHAERSREICGTTYALLLVCSAVMFSHFSNGQATHSVQFIASIFVASVATFTFLQILILLRLKRGLQVGLLQNICHLIEGVFAILFLIAMSIALYVEWNQADIARLRSVTLIVFGIVGTTAGIATAVRAFAKAAGKLHG